MVQLITYKPLLMCSLIVNSDMVTFYRTKIQRERSHCWENLLCNIFQLRTLLHFHGLTCVTNGYLELQHTCIFFFFINFFCRKQHPFGFVYFQKLHKNTIKALNMVTNKLKNYLCQNKVIKYLFPCEDSNWFQAIVNPGRRCFAILQCFICCVLNRRNFSRRKAATIGIPAIVLY